MIAAIRNQSVLPLMEECRNEQNVDIQIEILRKINTWLPKSKQLKLPTLMTNDYVFKALDILEDRLEK